MNFKHFQFSMLALGAVALASCSDSDDAILQTPGDNSISFSTYVGDAISRASSIDIQGLQNSENGFGVFATWDKGLGWNNGSKLANFMNNQQVLYNDGIWTYSPIKYWPAGNEKVSFFAYAPYKSEFDYSETDESRISTAYAMSRGVYTVGYNLGSDIRHQEDFIYATAKDMTNSVSQIQFQFKHALTKLGFMVTGWSTPASQVSSTITINGISLSTNMKSGHFNLCTEAWWSEMSGSETKSFIIKDDLLQNNIFTDVDGHSGRINTDDGFIFTLPTINSVPLYCIMIDYTIETLDEKLEGGKVVARNKVYRYLRPVFEKGKSYIININLGLDGEFGGDDGNNDGDSPNKYVPNPVDPNPEDPTIPCEPGASTSIRFSATVNNWDGTDVGLNIPLDTVGDKGEEETR